MWVSFVFSTNLSSQSQKQCWKPFRNLWWYESWLKCYLSSAGFYSGDANWECCSTQSWDLSPLWLPCKLVGLSNQPVLFYNTSHRFLFIVLISNSDVSSSSPPPPQDLSAMWSVRWRQFQFEKCMDVSGHLQQHVTAGNLSTVVSFG